MKVAFFIWGLMAPLQAIPNAVLGALAEHDSPLNGQDLTKVFVSFGRLGWLDSPARGMGT
jgi:hypothetical protein